MSPCCRFIYQWTWKNEDRGVFMVSYIILKARRGHEGFFCLRCFARRPSSCPGCPAWRGGGARGRRMRSRSQVTSGIWGCAATGSWRASSSFRPAHLTRPFFDCPEQQKNQRALWACKETDIYAQVWCVLGSKSRRGNCSQEYGAHPKNSRRTTWKRFHWLIQ